MFYSGKENRNSMIFQQLWVPLIHFNGFEFDYFICLTITKSVFREQILYSNFNLFFSYLMINLILLVHLHVFPLTNLTKKTLHLTYSLKGIVK